MDTGDAWARHLVSVASAMAGIIRQERGWYRGSKLSALSANLPWRGIPMTSSARIMEAIRV